MASLADKSPIGPFHKEDHGQPLWKRFVNRLVEVLGGPAVVYQRTLDKREAEHARDLDREHAAAALASDSRPS